MNELEENTPLVSAPVRTFIQNSAISLSGFCLIIAGVVIVVMLGSADQGDPSYNTASGAAVKNWLGVTGAQISSFLFEMAGPMAFIMAVPFFAWGIRIARFCQMPRWKARLLMILLSWLFLTGAAELLFGTEVSGRAGGEIGRLYVGFVDLLTRNMVPIDGVNIPLIAGGLSALAGIILLIWGCAIPARFIGNAARVPARLVYLPIASLLRRRPAQADETFDDVQPEDDMADDIAGSAEAQPTKKRSKKTEKPKKSAKQKRREPTLAGAAARTAEPSVSQGQFDFDNSDFKLPPLKLLKTPPKQRGGPAQSELDDNAQALTQVLGDFRIQGAIEEVRYGPVVTRYGLNPAPGTKSQRVIALADDIARSMAVISVRVAVVPGQNIIGIELPNDTREMVLLRHILDHPDWQSFDGGLPVALGKDIAGEPIIADLARMPHLLVAGTTGSGKSVGVNGMILSQLYRYTPEQCRLIMIDPKMLELSVYDGIPHLLSPVVTEPPKAVMALKWAVREMETRYRNMAKLGVRNIGGYNERLAEARAKGEVLTRRVQTGFDPETGKPVYEEDMLDLSPLPFIVVIIDEVADLMLVAGKEIEAAVQRLAQMARAAGIHVIMATQRPSVDVITGTIKANFPTRISFQVTSRIDSRTILGEQGAEQLLGKGDMLYMEGGGRVTRIHGPFVDDREVEEVANFLRAQGEPEYNQSVTEEAEEAADMSASGAGGSPSATGNSLYDEAVALVIREQKASTSFVQRHLKIGYNRAATLIEEMESAGIISPSNHVGKRDVLVAPEDQ